jgi:TPR repeat protein
VPPMDDGPKKNGSLPDPELNPMLNPTLGKNLGRWAQVYFTSPPEKREEAVQELLKELQDGSATETAVQDSPSARTEAKPPQVRTEPIPPPVRTEPISSTVRREPIPPSTRSEPIPPPVRSEAKVPQVRSETNPPRILDVPPVLTGFNPVASTEPEAEEEEEDIPLTKEARPAKSPLPAAEVSYRQRKELFPDEIEGPEPEFEAEERPRGEICPACLHKNEPGQRFCGFCGFSLKTDVEEPAPPARQTRPVPIPVEPARAPAPVRPASLHADERDAETWQWLHEKNLAKLAVAQERKARWKVPLIAFLLLAIACGYLYWRSTTGEADATKAAAKQPPIGQTQGEGASDPRSNASSGRGNAANHARGQGAPTQSQVPRKQTTAPPEAKTQTPLPPVVASRNVTPKEPPRSAEMSAPEANAGTPYREGLQELTLGRKYLNGEGVPRDHATAAKWLWKSVGKQNPDAVLLLSDLYVRGDGVPQSCDQARILLSAAAKRGSPGAADKLRSVLAVCR